MDGLYANSGRDRNVMAILLTLCLVAVLYKVHALLSPSLAATPVESHALVLRFLLTRVISDGCAWLATGVICWTLIKLAWKLRGRVRFGATLYLLIVMLMSVAAKRAIEFYELREVHLVDPHLTTVSAVVSFFIGVVALLLVPFVRRVVEIGLTATSEHDKFVAAAETNANAFFILESSRNVLGLITDFRFCFLNGHAELLMQHSRKRLINRRVCRVWPAIRTSGTFDKLVQVVRTGLPYAGEIAGLDHSGRQRSYSLQVVKMADGIAVVMSDLSEERMRQQRMEEMHRFSQSIIENAPFSIVATDANGTILAMNVATEELTQYRKRELVGLHSMVLLHDPAELSTRSIALSESLGKPVLAGFQTLTSMLNAHKTDAREWTYMRKDGKRTPVHMGLTVLRGTNQEVTGYLAVAFDISERKRLTDSITHMAHHDALTNLPNRAFLQERMREGIHNAKSSQKQVGVLMIDLDNFKRINDSLGHHAGDQLLTAVADRIRSSIRKTDTVARVGGDEFVVLLEDLSNEDGAVKCASKILANLKEDIALNEQLVNVTASIGICMYPERGADPSELLRNADSAMYSAKQSGMNGIVTYSKNVKSGISNALRLERELRHAIANNEMHLHYQPQVDCRSGEIKGVEALIRWTHPTRGELPPGEFIETAETSGIIVAMGEWVLERACKEVAALQHRLGRRLTLAVNLSAKQFRQPNLYGLIERVLNETGLPPEDLELEITEHTLMQHSSESIAQLSKLRELGVRLAIDDFGTGFSSFKYILEYKVDCLKIDRSFISKCPTDINATSIVRTVIAMAHGLGMRVVAEGVELPEQMAFLLRRHCDQVQGFLLSRPISMTALTEKMTSTSLIPVPTNVIDQPLLVATHQ